MTAAITLRAGASARRLIEQDGLTPDAITLLGAPAGGPKFLITKGLDDFLFGEWLPNRQQPLPAFGSSVGAFRLVAAAHRSPQAALQRLVDAYCAKCYDKRPSASELTTAIREIFQQMHDEQDTDYLLNHPWLQLHIVTTRCQGLAASRHPLPQSLGFGMAYLSNLAHRDRLATRFQRCVFHAGAKPFNLIPDAFTTEFSSLTKANITEVTLASGSIPIIMETRRDLPDSAPGAHIDGGMIDYHMDIRDADENAKQLVFIPHYEQRVVPGWFDKKLLKRQAQHQDHLLVLSPSPELVASLPGGKVPCRKDFTIYKNDDAARLKAWRAALDASERMADAFREVLAKQRVMDVLAPLA